MPGTEHSSYRLPRIAILSGARKVSGPNRLAELQNPVTG
jgi:hypothetical protein